ncbi:protein GLUTAMINE DUMPER 3-like [Zingiber officinale]|uniref:protein GLUTAMINE DUMPER 3-like n=1 Tax=Zingiber officinale TaxID=94328 RepID=UPI001C4A7F70|nr:protein GLUTAMINE DUMPER 3-like [Zingiber officinale]XP_042459544.1 protein GLUTAMINE DUMPER 3-like [Zingiber officinale]XP_042459545.1 protein GLUTAMINE DUMPER 3-like [Zingiber officinale]XP_042459546.1 protein GLUTAMINE DUMPER 3-like [Zingiber officinale]
MRAPAGFTADGDGASLLSSPPSSSAATAGGGSQSAWHSPVPYLFGGLAAMLGLIALALLILACSYWKLSSYLDSSYLDSSDADDGAEGPSTDHQKRAGGPAVLEERFLVIMPGDDAPTVLAIPISKPSSANSSATVTTDQGNGEPSASAVT